MNHGYPPPRAMVPQGGPSQRLNELLDNIRTEFETESQRSVDYEGQSKLPSPMSGCAYLHMYGVLEMRASGFRPA
jgi:hypothetical protein